ncbi:MAG TPA: 50S ribosomal protein L18 [Bacteroidia bacterium]|nr:50S ribosomal protein L18 [Bacteroidia bacterium]
MKSRNFRREKIKKRIRSKVNGNSTRPRLSVFRSNSEIYAQLIDDSTGKTIASISSLGKNSAKAKGSKSDKAKSVGSSIAKIATDKGIQEVVFDRNGYLYHGRVKAVAEAAREAGLKF